MVLGKKSKQEVTDGERWCDFKTLSIRQVTGVCWQLWKRWCCNHMIGWKFSKEKTVLMHVSTSAHCGKLAKCDFEKVDFWPHTEENVATTRVINSVTCITKCGTARLLLWSLFSKHCPQSGLSGKWPAAVLKFDSAKLAKSKNDPMAMLN